MASHTRRDFLTKTSLTVAALGFAPRVVQGAVLRSSETANTLLPDPTDRATLHVLATRAVDVAKQAGAQYADIRVAQRRTIRIRLYDGWPVPITEVTHDISYGVRALVNGAWAFSYGSAPTLDAVTAATQQATRDAREYARAGRPAPEYLKAPVVTGEWVVPFTIDPFDVPLTEQINLLGAYQNAGKRTPGLLASQNFDWTAETRVLASTDGSLVTQEFRRSHPAVGIAMSRRYLKSAFLYVPAFVATSEGYESALRPELQERVKETAEEVRRIAMLPERPLEVGRYEAVFDGQSFAAVGATTIAPAFGLDRILGNDAEAGTSFLAPAEESLGTELFSSRLTMRADQSLPCITSAKWDDEGVATEPFTLVQKGRVVDFVTTRSTAVAMSSWYRQQNLPVRSHGCAVAWSVTRPPVGAVGHLTIADGGAGAPTLDAMVGGMRRGVLVRFVQAVSTDQGLTSGSVNYAELYEIQGGKIVARARGNSIQFRTKPFWKSISAFGDASSVQTHTHDTECGQPWWAITQSITAPAALVPEVDVVLLPRSANSF